MRFKEFLESIGYTKSAQPVYRPDDTSSGMSKQDFSSLSMDQRMAQGRDIGEPFIIKQLAKHGVHITPVTDINMDRNLKIDGFLNNEPVQIKLRRSGRGDRNDIAFELIRRADRNTPIMKLLEKPYHQGRDWKGTTVKHYFVMNKGETEICHTSAAAIRQAVVKAITELNMSPSGGKLLSPFAASNGVELRPTRDPDPTNYVAQKVMAFVPAELVAEKKYKIIP